MVAKKNPELTKREQLIKSWKQRADYKGYDRSKGSSYNSWRAIIRMCGAYKLRDKKEA